MPHSHSSRLQNLAAVLAVLHPSNETGATVLSARVRGMWLVQG
jgi:hypothetical protein